LRKYYFTYKSANKKSRWLYDEATSKWTRKKTTAYSDAFLDKFIRTIFNLVFVSLCLFWVFLNLPFAGVVFAFDRGKILLGSTWLMYFLIMLSINKMISSTFNFFLTGTIITTIMLVFSDLIINKYNTVIYNFFLYASIICFLYILIIRYIKRLTIRKNKPQKQLKDPMNPRNF